MEKTTQDEHSLRDLLFLLRPYRGVMVMAILALISCDILGATMPWVLKIAIDRIFPGADYPLYLILFAVMIIIFAMRNVLRYIYSFLLTYSACRILIDLRQKLFRHLQTLSMRFYDENKTGRLISNVVVDVNSIHSALSAIAQLFDQLLMVVLISALLLVLNWQIGLIVLAVLPIHWMNYNFFRKKMKAKSKEIAESFSQISSNLNETLSGTRVVKSFAKEHSACHHFFQTMRPQLYWTMRLTRDNVGLWSVFDFIAMFTRMIVIGIGIAATAQNRITLGEFVALYTYLSMIESPLNVLSNLSAVFASGEAGASRINKLMSITPEVTDLPGAVPAGRLRGEIEFHDVGFSYDRNREETISHFSLKIAPGQKVALVGASGSGKTTISNLLLRFYDVDSGFIKVDGTDIRKYKVHTFRDNIGVVMQEPFLFSGTIRENIGYAKQHATDAEIENAAKIANVAEFVKDLPDGYDTVIGERGTTLSGGQKQRIAIARAILKDPAMLLLDEATSALDTVSEFLVQEALDNVMQHRTTIIIAHRLSTVQNADLIVVMDKGCVVQTGRHEELLNAPGAYQNLYLNQKKLAQGGSVKL